MGVELITGYKGSSHVSSSQAGGTFAGVFGEGTYLLPVGNRCEATMTTSTNCHIDSGFISMQGRQIEVSSTDLTIGTGVSGSKRRDLVCVQYKKDTSTSKESADLVVKKGTSTTGTPTDPSYTAGNIIGGASLAEAPLYRINIDGLAVSGVDKIAPTTSSFTPSVMTFTCSGINGQIRLMTLNGIAALYIMGTARTNLGLWYDILANTPGLEAALIKYASPAFDVKYWQEFIYNADGRSGHVMFVFPSAGSADQAEGTDLWLSDGLPSQQEIYVQIMWPLAV